MHVASEGLTTTFRVLAQADSEAVGRVLESALDCGSEIIQEEALVGILTRRDLGGQRELLRRWDSLDSRWREIIKKHRSRMIWALRDAVLGSDLTMCASGCHAAVWLREYDLIPALLNTLSDPLSASGDLVALTLLGLTEQLYEELSLPPEDGTRRDPQLVRQHAVSGLEEAVQRYGRHKRREAIEAFLILVNRDNVTLKQILQDPHHPAFLALVDALLKSPRPGVIRLLLNFLDDPHAPSAAVTAVGNRGDAPFVRYLLRKIGREPSPVVRQNLKRITAIAWLRNLDDNLESLDDGGQHALVRLVMASGIPRQQAFATIAQLMSGGSSGGRRAAAEALEEFNGGEANSLALAALDDADPHVQAAVLGHIRRRGIPGMLSRLIDLLESPHLMVRQAARKSLAEFSFKRFIGAFDMLDEAVRRSTGALVKKIDSHTIPLLQSELRSRVRTRRLRGLAIARSMDAVAEIEPLVVELLQDEDHLIRAEAAAALASSRSEESLHALEELLGDRSLVVQEAAQKSLAARKAGAAAGNVAADFPERAG
jgi:HEAT repeat protein